MEIGILGNLTIGLTAELSLVYTTLTGKLGALALAALQSVAILVIMVAVLAITVHQYGIVTLT